MTKEEAVIQMELLQLALGRVRKEIRDLLKQFCEKGVSDDHYFKKLWAPLEDGKLFRVVGYVCVLCGFQKPLEFRDQLCPICRDALPEQVSGETEEDVVGCNYCGWNNLKNSAGISFQAIPGGDEVRL